MKMPNFLVGFLLGGIALIAPSCTTVQDELGPEYFTLVKAAGDGDLPTVKRCLEGGIPIDIGKRIHSTALIEAVSSGQKEVVLYLLERGADPNETDAGGDTPLHHAAQLKDEKAEMARILHAKGAKAYKPNLWGITSLHMACEENNAPTINCLLYWAGGVNAQDRDGQTPLHYAVKAGAVKAVELLLNGDADPNILDFFQESPLHCAIEGNHNDILLQLLEVGPRLDLWTDDSPLHTACWEENLEAAKILLACGAPVNARNSNGGTPLNFAEYKENAELINLLKSHGGISAKAYACDGPGRKPTKKESQEYLKKHVRISDVKVRKLAGKHCYHIHLANTGQWSLSKVVFGIRYLDSAGKVLKESDRHHYFTLRTDTIRPPGRRVILGALRHQKLLGWNGKIAVDVKEIGLAW